MRRKLTWILGIALLALPTAAFAQPGPGGRGGEGRRGMRRPPGIDEVFERHDKNNDGILTAAELGERGKRLIEHADQDGDGAVSRAELEAARDKRRAERGGEGGGPGRRGDGPPSGGERERRERPSAEEMFKKLDADGDGVITLEEFKKHHAERKERGPRGGRRGGRRGPPPGQDD